MAAEPRSGSRPPAFCAAVLAAVLFLSFDVPDTGAFTDAPADETLGCVADFLFFNECSGVEDRLIVWNEGEDFPSLGIGHFIWYPKGRESAFQQTFPGLLRYLETAGFPPPVWVRELPDLAAPWATREDFLKERSGERVLELQAYLFRSRRAQAAYIIRRLTGILPKLMAGARPEERASVERWFDLLMSSQRGPIALIDYVNFKGEGVLESERYQGQGWGLLQVLQEMGPAPDAAAVPDLEQDAVRRFTDAALDVLARRAANAPAERGEARWLPGWQNRVRRYLTWEC
jgi:hypothetical protein